MKEAIEQGQIRITTWNDDTVTMVDCQYAGKRGKECTRITIRVDPCDSQHSQALLDITHNMKSVKKGAADTLEKVVDYDTMFEFLEVAEAFHDGKFKYYINKEKGVRVQPLGFEDITISNEKMYFHIGYEGWCASDKTDMANEPRWIDTHDTKKADYKKLYKWVEKNKAKIEEMSMNELTRAVSDELGIRGHSYCAMD